MPSSELSRSTWTPTSRFPTRATGSCSTDLPSAAIDAIVEAFVGSSLLHVEVRHLGGAAAIRSPDHGVLDAIDQPFVLLHLRARVRTLRRWRGRCTTRRRLLGALGPWDSGRRYLNFAESRVDPRSIFPVESFERLQRIKAAYDPTDLFQANHPISRISG